MLNKIRRLIGAPFIVVTGVIFGLLIWLFYGKDDVHRFCDWLDSQTRLESLKKLRRDLIKMRIRDV
jgi:hypothetical protein